MKIAIVAAMSEELAPFRAAHPGRKVVLERGPISIEEVSSDLLLVQSGIGKANAAACSALLCDHFAPDLVINTGTTGSFDRNFKLGDVVVSSTFRYSDVDATGFDYAWGQVPQMPVDYPVREDLLKTVLETLQAVSQFDFGVHTGFIATSDSFMSSVANVAQIREKLPHISASDMESAALAQVASFFGVDVVNIRGISDHVGSDAAQLFDDTLDLAAQNAAHCVLELVDRLQKG